MTGDLSGAWSPPVGGSTVHASYACWSERSRGRRFVEEATPYRSEFQRDRDRIVHSTAFRRLVYKTQVFLNHEGDLFRTRLTHSLEVAQLGRSIARALRLDEDLVEAVAIAHDLGHTPFGHAGQDALNGCMQAFGGFEHNLQSLRIVDVLEERYPSYDGLNLTFETREGILKHCSQGRARAIEAREPRYSDGHPGGVAQRFLTGQQPSLEAQLCNLADEIAYNAHDVDDGVRSGLITLDQVREVPLFNHFVEKSLADFPQLGQPQQARRLMYASIRLMLSAQVHDVIDTTRFALQETQPDSVDAVRRLPLLVRFSPDMRAQSLELKRFLFSHLYRHPSVTATMEHAGQIIRELFDAYAAAPSEMQADFAHRAELVGNAGQEQSMQRIVCDYVAGMTDRFAAREHERLTGRRLFSGMA